MTTVSLALVMTVAQAAPAIEIQDPFRRDVTTRGIELVDWEGPIANPAPTFWIVPKDRLYKPARITLSCANPLIQFELFSEVGPDGSKKSFLIDSKGTPQSFRISPFPSLESFSGELEVKVEDSNEHVYTYRVPLKVDQPKLPDSNRKVKPLSITTDYTQDPTDFFKTEIYRRVVEQAADAWRFYLADPGFDRTPKEDQVSWVFDAKTFSKGRDVKNPVAYTGMYMFVQGISVDDYRSTGVASYNGKEHTISGKGTGIRRSCSIAMETTGNYNRLGWLELGWDQEYWKASNQTVNQHDFYSVARHEMGHALGFHRVHPAFANLMKDGIFLGKSVEAYYGKKPPINQFEHFDGIIDPASGVGVFGNEYGGIFPRKRWLLTKFDLLAMKDVGFDLQDRSPFRALEWIGPREVILGGEGNGQGVVLAGGVAPYRVTVAEGSLPPGVELDSFTGQITGVPKEPGRWTLQLRAEDWLGGAVQREVTLILR